MWRYNFSLALRSLQDKPGLTLLMVLVMSIGLGLYITFYTMAVNEGEVPHGHKALSLHLVQMDNREASADKISRPIRMPDTTYRDAMNLLSADMPATRQTMVFRTYGTLSVEDDNIRPIQTRGAATTAEFFAMFEPPFLYGGSWQSSADEQGAGVVVIYKTMNERLFGGKNSVGDTILLENQPMTIVGVLDDWYLSRRIYDRGYRQGYPHDYFVPANYGLNQQLFRDHHFDCWDVDREIGLTFDRENTELMKTSECGWLAFWAEFPGQERDLYQQKLNSYIQEQKAFGRFPRDEVDTYLFNVKEQIEYVNNNFGGGSEVLMAQMFFAVCLLNAVGILLAKFVRRAKEVSLRRALGARKSAIISQHLIEVGLLGLISGVIGLAIAWLGLKAMVQVRLYATDYRVRVEDILHYFALDWQLVAHAFVISLICSLVVSIYPIWRISSQSSASQLRAQ